MIRLNSDTKFNFKCVCCGKCCKDNLDVFLNPLDVWNLRNEKRQPTTFLHRHFIKIEIRSEYSAYPFCFIKMQNGRCPFLEENLCMIHPSRPAGCRAYPVSQTFNRFGTPEFVLSSDVENCPGLAQKKEYTLAEWLDIIKFEYYREVVEFMPELYEKLRNGADEFVLLELANIFYNFDEIDDFPFKEDYRFDPRHDTKFAKWMIRKARAALRFV